MSLERTLNCAEKEGSVSGYPRERPTVPYAETISNRQEKMVNAGSLMFCSRFPSMMAMKNNPKKMYQRSKLSCRRR